MHFQPIGKIKDLVIRLLPRTKRPIKCLGNGPPKVELAESFDNRHAENELFEGKNYVTSR
jgi:hypothetical protein